MIHIHRQQGMLDTGCSKLALRCAVGSMEAVALEYACYCCRGIDVVRNKIKMFAQTKVTLPPGRHKMVILDEADR